LNCSTVLYCIEKRVLDRKAKNQLFPAGRKPKHNRERMMTANAAAMMVGGRRSFLVLLLVALLLGASTTHAFLVSQPSSFTRNDVAARTDRRTSLSSTSNKPDLVDQKTFVAAIQRIENEIYAIEQQQLQQGQQGGGGGTDGGSDQRQQQQQRQPVIDPDVVLAIGRLHVELPVDTQPELDLTESAGPLVLVTGVWGRTAEETGLQVYDTIVSVSVGGEGVEQNQNGDNGQQQQQQQQWSSQPTFSAYTKGQTLDQTAAVLTAAAQHALQSGGTRITLEVNRLIQGFYANEQEQEAAFQQSYDAAAAQDQQQDWQQ
jgi:hypothetical protein